MCISILYVIYPIPNIVLSYQKLNCSGRNFYININIMIAQHDETMRHVMAGPDLGFIS